MTFEEHKIWKNKIMNGKVSKRIRKIAGSTAKKSSIQKMKRNYNKLPRNIRGNFLDQMERMKLSKTNKE